MNSQKPVSYEFKHIKCGEDIVQAVINQHQLFFWEVVGTNTVLSRDSHLESGGIFDQNTIYSVTITERFSTADFRRAKDLPRLSELKPIESQYFSLVSQLENLGSSALNNYGTPPPKQFSWIVFLLLCCFYVIPGALYWRSKNKKHRRVCSKWQELKTELDSLLNNNHQLLNV